MARRTAIRVTRNADTAEREGIPNLAADEQRRAAKRDAVPEVMPTAAEMLRRHRERSTDDERSRALLKRAKDAASLELRGDDFSAEDRLDTAAELVIDVLAKYRPHVPEIDDRRVSLTVLCGDAANIRRRIVADRQRDHAEYLRRAAERGDDGYTAAERAAIEDRAIRAADDVDLAAEQSRQLAARLDCAPSGPVADVLYQWLRNASGKGASGAQCAAERGYTAGSWRVRVSTGGKLLRAALPNALALLDAVLPADAIIIDADGTLTYALRDDSREAGARTRMLADVPTAEHWREGTAAGSRPSRPADKRAADAVCKLRRMRGNPDKLRAAAEQRRERARRGRRDRVSIGRTSRYVQRNGVSDVQARADAQRAIGRMYARDSRREQSVSPPIKRAE